MIEKSQELTWLESNGGPLLLLSSNYLPHWHGDESPLLGTDTEMHLNYGKPTATDYERACMITEYLGILAVGPGRGLVLGGDPLPAAWVPNSSGGHSGIIVRWIAADDERHVLETLAQIPSDIWEPYSVDFVVGTQPLVLFDAVFRGNQLSPENHLNLRLPPGFYRIGSTVFQPDESIELVLHRFVRLSA